MADTDELCLRTTPGGHESQVEVGAGRRRTLRRVEASEGGMRPVVVKHCCQGKVARERRTRRKDGGR